MQTAVKSAEITSIGRAIPEGCHPVFARFAHFVNCAPAENQASCPGRDADIHVFEHGEDVIGVTDLPDEGGAHTLVLSGLAAGWASRADMLEVGADAIVFDGQVFPRAGANVYRDAARIRAFAALPQREQSRRFALVQDVVCERAAPLSMAVVLDPARKQYFRGSFAEALSARFLEGASACRAGEYARAVRLLQGVGYGLTPSGDDFIAGMLYALHFAEPDAALCAHSERAQRASEPDALRAHPAHTVSCAAGSLPALDLAIRSTLCESAPMSRAFLKDALEGRWPKRLRDAAESIAEHGSTDEDICAAATRVLAHGATSGADLLCGFLCAAMPAIALAAGTDAR